MNWLAIKYGCEAVCVLTLAGCAIYAVRDWHETNMEARSAVASLNEALIKLNAPCTGFHGSASCGILAQAAQTEKNIGILAGQATEQVRQSATLVNAASSAVQSASADIHGVAVAGAETAHSASGALQEAQEAIHGLQPLTASLTRTADASSQAVADFDALVKSPDLAQALTHVEEMTASGDAILADGRRVSDKLTADYLKPKTFWGGLKSRAGDTFDIAAFLARHY